MDRLTMPEAIDAVGRMMSGYANSGKNVGDSYIGAIAALLCSYPRSIALDCANPISGVARNSKFLPTVADVVAWCEPFAEQMGRRIERESRVDRQLRERAEFERKNPPRRSPVPSGCRANVFVPAGSSEHARMLEEAKTADSRDYHAQDVGIWVPLTWLQHRATAPTFKRYTDAELMAIYGADRS